MAINYQEVIRDDYHEYLELAEKLPEEMKKRGIFELVGMVLYHKKKGGVEATEIIFSHDGTFKIPELNIEKTSLNSIDKLLEIVCGKKVANLGEVSSANMKKAADSIKNVFENICSFNTYLPKK